MAITLITEDPKKNPRLHFDIYAILEGSQELYFGHETQVNVNQVETVKLKTKEGEDLLKCYLSPTKRRGIERRCLIWAPLTKGVLLGDELSCGIPKTCVSQDCPICSTFGGLEVGKKTLIGRVTHGGGVAIQPILAEEKQRAMHPSRLANNNEETPIPFKREYNQPGIFYPVYNHCLSITDEDFATVAYAFLDSLPRMGAGNPKGIALAEDNDKPLLVVDRYLVPKGKRPIISPSETDAQEAIKKFWQFAYTPQDSDYIQGKNFERWVGDEALNKLQEYADIFVEKQLQQ